LRWGGRPRRAGGPAHHRSAASHGARRRAGPVRGRRHGDGLLGGRGRSGRARCGPRGRRGLAGLPDRRRPVSGKKQRGPVTLPPLAHPPLQDPPAHPHLEGGQEVTGTVGTAVVSLALVAAAGALTGALVTLAVCALVETRRLRHIRQQRRVITALTRRLTEVDAEGSR